MATWRNSAHIRDRARARLRREAGPCHICGQPIDYLLVAPDPMSFELDHIQSIDRFPELTFVPSNWAASHKQCNRSKSNKVHAPIIKKSNALKR